MLYHTPEHEEELKANIEPLEPHFWQLLYVRTNANTTRFL